MRTRILVVVVVIIAFILIGFGVWFNRKLELPVLEQTVEKDPRQTIIGSSVQDRPIEAFTFGGGDKQLVFVGGIHGGYEWNSVLLAYEFIDYLADNPEVIPADLHVSIIPVLNPDGLNKVVGKDGRFDLTDIKTNANLAIGTGRFNANNVDLNRNFDCKWQSESNWRGNVVSAGTAPFSEPEAIALRDFIDETKPVAVVFWHSQSNAVYASECENGILARTRTLMNVYAKSAGYPAVDSFTAYAITGDAEGWLASIGIPAITVELATHEAIEWSRNLAGVKALFDHYSQALE